MSAYTAVSIFTAAFLFGHFFAHSDTLGIVMGLGVVGLYSAVAGRR